MELFLFYAFAVLAIGSALLLVSLRNTARSLFLFFITLFGMAGLFLFAFADFVAITQIMVYVGGVLILMIFAFMLSNKELLQDLQHGKNSLMAFTRWQAVFVSVGFLVVLTYALWQWDSEGLPLWMQQNIQDGNIIQATDNNIPQLGIKFMTEYVLAFEVISIFLLMALIGASHIARKEPEND
ncbi:NADH-quinone oxidoreductase subunit J [Sphingobacteriaceae bacterium WQ 2009]|uniref:NADH-quinone oxidoreductase subunit J n=1 Tax=Rhinopithecimicrobium faecis TaxID=2820698 RepID=A0A8T4H9Z3_9SPHI|nr:NADH-quinone oxidoreductase subunit J [Sphingobacteriaceae bacterium WQ 2009]